MLIDSCLVARFFVSAHEIYGQNPMKDSQAYTEFTVLKQDSEILSRKIPQTFRVNSM